MLWDIIPEVASLIGSGYKALKSKSQDRAAAAEGSTLRRPFYQIPTEDIQNKNIWEQQATGGLTADEKTLMGEQRDRGLSASLEALRETGGGPNDFAKINSVFNDSLKSQSALDSQAHLKNIEMFTNANKELAAQKTTAWGVNELQPYESKLKEIQDRRIAAQTNENNAVNEGIGSLSALGTTLNSRNPIANPRQGGSSPSPYSRKFGLADTGGVAGSSAAGFPSINPQAPDIMNTSLTGTGSFPPAPMVQGADDDWYGTNNN